MFRFMLPHLKIKKYKKLSRAPLTVDTTVGLDASLMTLQSYTHLVEDHMLD